MNISATCINCLLSKQYDKIKDLPDEEKKHDFMMDLMRIFIDNGELRHPELSGLIHDTFERYYGPTGDKYAEGKRSFNELMLKTQGEIAAQIEKSDDPLSAALRYARAGNYIDYGAVRNVNTEKLTELLQAAALEQLDAGTYAAFCTELAAARSLVVLLDNCGEIVLDKLLIETIIKLYPQLTITAVVRGGPVINDATPAEAAEVGLDRVVRVVGNGAAIAGTPLGMINAQTRALLNDADLILAKGQGNYDSLNGMGFNVYYLLLCKCEWFCRHFHAEPNDGRFFKE